MEVGKLYKVSGGFFFVYPSCNLSYTGAQITRSSEEAIRISSWYSRAYDCNVTYISPDEYFVLLQIDGFQYRILSGNGEMGWITASLKNEEHFSEFTRE